VRGTCRRVVKGVGKSPLLSSPALSWKVEGPLQTLDKAGEAGGKHWDGHGRNVGSKWVKIESKPGQKCVKGGENGGGNSGLMWGGKRWELGNFPTKMTEGNERRFCPKQVVG
jgi:hypothetical protein